jgi:hypothetical protein
LAVLNSANVAGGPSHENVRVNATENLVTTGSFYSEGLVRSPSRASSRTGSGSARFGTQRSLDQNLRALSPTASLRHTENRIITEQYEIETDSELNQSIDIPSGSLRRNSDKNGSPTYV